MTIKNVIDFYFSQFETLKVQIQMWGGIYGKYHTVTKEEFYKLFSDWSNEKVISIDFQTHYHNSAIKEIRKCDIPMLYILYIDEEDE